MGKPVKKRFRLKRADGTEEVMEATTITGIIDPEGKMATMLNFDRQPDGTWRFVYNTAQLAKADDFVSIEVIP